MANNKKTTGAPANTPQDNATADVKKEQKGVVSIEAARKYGLKKALVQAAKSVIVLMAIHFTYFGHHAVAGPALGLLVLLPDGMQMSGRSGSVVYMKDGRRRNFANVAAIYTTAASHVKALFGNFSSKWNALSDANRAAWNGSEGIIRSDIFGRPKTVKGKNYYIGANMNNALIGAGELTNPGTTGALPLVQFTSVAASSLTNEINCVVSGLGDMSADQYLQIAATNALSPGTSKPGKSRFRDIVVADNTATSPIDIRFEWVAKFGGSLDSNAGKRIFVRIDIVDSLSGQKVTVGLCNCVIDA